jgi:hypothetical protein
VENVVSDINDMGKDELVEKAKSLGLPTAKKNMAALRQMIEEHESGTQDMADGAAPAADAGDAGAPEGDPADGGDGGGDAALVGGDLDDTAPAVPTGDAPLRDETGGADGDPDEVPVAPRPTPAPVDEHPSAPEVPAGYPAVPFVIPPSQLPPHFLDGMVATPGLPTDADYRRRG